VYILIIKIKPSQQSFSANTTIPSKRGGGNCFRTPELADNTAIHNLWKHFIQKLIAEEKLSG
jgi:hypothetical protein